jgi:hypothetical protein
MIWSVIVFGAGFCLAGYTLQGHIDWTRHLAAKGLMLGILFGYLVERSIFGRPD